MPLRAASRSISDDEHVPSAIVSASDALRQVKPVKDEDDGTMAGSASDQGPVQKVVGIEVKRDWATPSRVPASPRGGPA